MVFTNVGVGCRLRPCAVASGLRRRCGVRVTMRACRRTHLLCRATNESKQAPIPVTPTGWRIALPAIAAASLVGLLESTNWLGENRITREVLQDIPSYVTVATGFGWVFCVGLTLQRLRKVSIVPPAVSEKFPNNDEYAEYKRIVRERNGSSLPEVSSYRSPANPSRSVLSDPQEVLARKEAQVAKLAQKIAQLEAAEKAAVPQPAVKKPISAAAMESSTEAFENLAAEAAKVSRKVVAPAAEATQSSAEGQSLAAGAPQASAELQSLFADVKTDDSGNAFSGSPVNKDNNGFNLLDVIGVGGAGGLGASLVLSGKNKEDIKGDLVRRLAEEQATVQKLKQQIAETSAAANRDHALVQKLRTEGAKAINASRAKIELQQQEKLAIQKEKELVEKALAAEQQVVAAAKREAYASKEALQAERAAKCAADSEIEELQAQLQESNVSLQIQRDLAHRVGADAAQAKAQISDANLRSSQFKNEASTLHETLQNEQKLRAQAEDRINELRHELQISAEHLSEREVELIEVGEENMDMRMEMKSLRAESAELAAQLKGKADDAAVIRQEANEHLKTVTLELDAERKNVIALREALQESENMIHTSQAAVQNLEAEVAAVREEAMQFTAQLKGLESQVRATESKLTIEQQSTEKLRDVNRGLRAELTDVKHLLHQTSSDSHVQTTRRGQESAMKQQAQMLARQVQDALKAKESADAQVTVLNAELTATKNALQQAKARMDEEKASREEAMLAVSQLRGAIDDVRAEVAAAQENAEALRQGLKEERDARTKAESIAVDLKNQLQTLSGQPLESRSKNGAQAAGNNDRGAKLRAQAAARQGGYDRDAKLKAQAAARQSRSWDERQRHSGGGGGPPPRGPRRDSDDDKIRSQAAAKEAEREAKIRAQAAARQTRSFDERQQTRSWDERQRQGGGAPRRDASLEAKIRAEAAVKEADREAKIRAQAAARQTRSWDERQQGAGRQTRSWDERRAPVSPRGGGGSEDNIRSQAAAKEAEREAKIRAQAAARQTRSWDERQQGAGRQTRSWDERRAPVSPRGGAGSDDNIRAQAAAKEAEREAKIRAQAAARQTRSWDERQQGAGRQTRSWDERRAPVSPRGGAGSDDNIRAQAAAKEAEREAKIRAQAAARQTRSWDERQQGAGRQTRSWDERRAPVSPRGGVGSEDNIRSQAAAKEAEREAKIRAQAAARQTRSWDERQQGGGRQTRSWDERRAPVSPRGGGGSEDNIRSQAAAKEAEREAKIRAQAAARQTRSWDERQQGGGRQTRSWDERRPVSPRGGAGSDDQIRQQAAAKEAEREAKIRAQAAARQTRSWDERSQGAGRQTRSWDERRGGAAAKEAERAAKLRAQAAARQGNSRNY